MLETIHSLPKQPGIYQYFDAAGRLLYIGKAKSLSNRVKNYFRFTPSLRPNPNQSQRIVKMLHEAVSLSYIVVESEHDALILENSLIKQLRPKYNILLRDDKTYPYIYVNEAEDFPRFEITRKVIRGKQINYFGPYSTGARDILNALYELCQLVQKKACLKGKKACLYHQIGKCLAPCEKKVDPQTYSTIVEEAKNYIVDKAKLLKVLRTNMHTLAESLRFEEAKELRDQIERIEKSETKTHIDLATQENLDIFAISHKEKKACVVKLFVRNGKVVSSAHNMLTLHEGYDEDELYTRTILEYYGQEKPPIIATILVERSFESQPIIQEHLSLLFEKKATISAPKIGLKRKLCELALTNANELLKQSSNASDEIIFSQLKELLQLQRTPERIEIFDNSHISGEATVGGMVVFDKNTFDKKSYRHYHLESKDEYSQMREMLFKRIESFEKNPPPDLWIIDGGKTLLSLAKSLVESSGAFLDIIAISKEKVDAKAYRAKGKAKDLLHTDIKTFELDAHDKRLHLVQKLRDEAHRFALSFHKKTKLLKDQESALLETKGISAAKIKKLLNHFGTFEAIKNATIPEISEVLNLRDANAIASFYQPRETP